MKRWLPLVLLAGCTNENPDLVIERQPITIAQVTDTAWTRGSVILAGDPGPFPCPQPLSLRMSIVDDADIEMPTSLTISQAKVETYGSGQATVSVTPVCQPTSCTAEINVTAAGT